MPRTPQRSGHWSLRQVSLAAGVSLATARGIVRHGHLDPKSLTIVDVLVLRVAAMLSALQPFDELRPANTARPVPVRDRVAIDAVRSAGLDLPDLATLVVTEDGARLAGGLAEISAATLEPVSSGVPFLALPVGRWARNITDQASTSP